MADTNWIGHAVSAFVGGMIGLLGSFFTSRAQLNNLLKVEREKHIKAREEQTYRAYNQIIKADGDFGDTFLDTHFGYEAFSFRGYQKIVRPQIFDNFHLLDGEIKEIALKIDKILALYNFNNEPGSYVGESEHGEAIMLYSALIEKVKMIVWKAPD